jgi:hypothetical protein
MERRDVRTGFLSGNLNEIDRLENLAVNGNTILKQIFKKSIGALGETDMALDRDRCRAVFDAVMNLRFS